MPNFNQNYSYKVGFLTDFGFLINVNPIFNVFTPFLGVIGHFWSLIVWRKLEMSN
jgi:hypothetical protein